MGHTKVLFFLLVIMASASCENDVESNYKKSESTSKELSEIQDESLKLSLSLKGCYFWTMNGNSLRIDLKSNEITYSSEDGLLLSSEEYIKKSVIENYLNVKFKINYIEPIEIELMIKNEDDSLFYKKVFEKGGFNLLPETGVLKHCFAHSI